MKIHILIALVLFCCLPVPAHAAIIHAASCSQADVQTAVNSAANGDTVDIPTGGSCTYRSAVTISGKYITIAGLGITTITTVAQIAFNVTQTTTGTTRITGFTFLESGVVNDSQEIVTFHGTTASMPFRLDHCTFTQPDQGTLVELQGNGPGLIDHNTFTTTGGSLAEMIHNFGNGANNWTDNIVPGGPNMVFIEDNTLTCPDGFCSALQSYNGARTVVRHNSFNFAQVDQHGTAGFVGARWWEIYDNNFNTPNGAQCCVMALRGGTGVVWGNTISGTNTGQGVIELFEEDTGTWPLAYQIGSGINGGTNQHATCSSGTLNSSPAYLWNNASPIQTPSQSPTLAVLNRDYFTSPNQPGTLLRQELSTDTCSTTYNYVPYTYPHPLQSASPTPPAPTGLTAVVQ
jgi:hypothetical protein